VRRNGAPWHPLHRSQFGVPMHSYEKRSQIRALHLLVDMVYNGRAAVQSDNMLTIRAPRNIIPAHFSWGFSIVEKLILLRPENSS
jgi:hypothetical protein